MRRLTFFRPAVSGACAGSLVLLAAVACGPGSSEDDKEPPPASYSRKASNLVLSVQPDGWVYTKDPGYYRTHSFWLYGNRRAVVVGADEKGQQDSAFPTIKTGFVRKDEMKTIMRYVTGSGMTGQKPPEFGTPQDPYDSPEGERSITTVSVHAGGVNRTVTYRKADDVHYDPGLTQSQKQQRSFLSSIQESINGAVKKKNYQPKRHAFIVRESDDASAGAEVRDWPGRDIATSASEWAGTKQDGTRCVMAPAGRTGEVLNAMRRAGDEELLWSSGGSVYEVRPHPLLPDARDCGTAHAYLVNPGDTG